MQTKYDVFLGLGSNILPEKNLPFALQELSSLFGTLTLSNTYESAAVGFDGPNFWNLVVQTETAMELESLRLTLRDIEYKLGRDLKAEKYSNRTVDIDILLYGNLTGIIGNLVLPREEITYNAFVLRPLSELHPEGVHAGLQLSYRTLWQNFDGDRELKLVKNGNDILNVDSNTENFGLIA